MKSIYKELPLFLLLIDDERFVTIHEMGVILVRSTKILIHNNKVWRLFFNSDLYKVSSILLVSKFWYKKTDIELDVGLKEKNKFIQS